MAGAGYKLFNTGDVLTAAQVNTYLMEQTVMVFADAAARTAALSGVVSEGMISYLKDTNAVEVYNGSAWVASDDPNAIQNTIVDAKGDLIAASAADTPARLAVGNNGETLVADSSASTGLRWQGSQAAGKNYVINGGFDVWQRGTSFTTGGYSADRWFLAINAGGFSSVAQTTTTAPEWARYYIRATANAASSNIQFMQALEQATVIPLRGRTMTLSAYIRGSFTGSANLTVQYSNSTDTLSSQTTSVTTSAFTITSSFIRQFITFTVPSDAVGLRVQVETNGTPMNNTQTFDVANVQLELGSVPTTFSRSGATLAGELAACQRYYYRQTADSAYSVFTTGQGYSSATIYANMIPPVTMRVEPTGLEFASIAVWDGATVTATSTPFLAIDSSFSSKNQVFLAATVASGGVQYRPYWIVANNTTSAYIGFSAEL